MVVELLWLIVLMPCASIMCNEYRIQTDRFKDQAIDEVCYFSNDKIMLKHHSYMVLIWLQSNGALISRAFVRKGVLEEIEKSTSNVDVNRQGVMEIQKDRNDFLLDDTADTPKSYKRRKMCMQEIQLNYRRSRSIVKKPAVALYQLVFIWGHQFWSQVAKQPIGPIRNM